MGGSDGEGSQEPGGGAAGRRRGTGHGPRCSRARGAGPAGVRAGADDADRVRGHGSAGQRRVSGPGLGGEVLRVSPGSVSTLTTDSSPTGGPDLDSPNGMAFLPNGDIVMTDDGRTNGARPIVVEVNPGTGARTLISGDGTGS